MATKNLARTAIEGGRGNRWERDLSHKEERAYTRAFLSKAANDVDYADARVPKRRRKVYKDFRDKLSAVSRWLDSNCGRPWSDVKHDIHTMFDERTTAGRHIMYDHMLRDVQDWPEDQKTWYGGRSYFVDSKGLLQKKPSRRWFKYVKPAVTTEEIIAWAAGRMVRPIGAKLFWCVTTAPVANLHFCSTTLREVKVSSVHCQHCKRYAPGFRQDAELDVNDAKFFNALASFQQDVVVLSKKKK